MITRILYNEEKTAYSRVVSHPIQTWEWGDFQESQGHRVYRLGVFDQQKLISAYMVSFHRIPHTNFSIGTILRGPAIDDDMMENVKKIAEKENAIFVKFEPDDIEKIYDNNYQLLKNKSVLLNYPNLVTSPKVAFYPHTFIVDLKKSEEDLLADMSQKTRYNIKIANRHGVTITHSVKDEDFEIYLRMLFDTTKRQGFYLHSEDYHRQQWSTLKSTGMVEIFLATFQGQTLAAFMIFKLKDRLFYPYGASLDVHREVMAPTLLMWEAIKYGQSLGLKTFDMWGCLGPDANASQPGFGFHRFKQGYGGNLVQFVGTYDLVINPQFYKIYNLVDKYRWKLLRLKASIFRS
ncbi:MAG: peptidoglycan bridge formation glycyltransferase FemA/FemB family protein [Candidatus Shapirobacteria bacterium]